MLVQLLKNKNDILSELIFERFSLINFLELTLNEVDRVFNTNIRKKL